MSDTTEQTTATDVLAGLGLAPEEETEETTDQTTETTEETQEETVEVPEGAKNPDAVKKALEAERATAKAAKARAKELERQLQEAQEASKPLEQRIEEANSKAQEAEVRALRFEVAAEAGLDLRLASRLSGSTKEELAADAKTVAELFGAKGPVAPPEGGLRPAPKKPENVEQAHNNTISALIASKRQTVASSDLFAGLEPAPED
jgi:predicted RNase H-like nuclease (RuvC/YqgF family)